MRCRCLRALLLAGGLLASLLLPLCAAGAEACSSWPQWEGFRTRYLSQSGRIIDPSTAGGVSTSEGQSYGLFFALVANDRDSFARILRWTEDNLAEGDLSARLPAWQWGQRYRDSRSDKDENKDGDSWGVIDNNPASDADLWIAYTLAEAGRLWHLPHYSALGQLLAERIVREESVSIAGFGRTLLPGTRGFEPAPGLYRLNPSYVPLQLMRRMATLYHSPEWRQLLTTSMAVIVRASPRGFAPDWVLYQADGGFQPDHASRALGSYNAIRVYLWAGMLAPDEPLRRVLLKTLAPVALHVQQNGMPPLQTDTRAGSASGSGPAGFSAAMLPFLAASGLHEAVSQQRLRVSAKMPLERSDNYYEQVLSLFGLGWLDGRFRFTKDGALAPRWSCSAH